MLYLIWFFYHLSETEAWKDFLLVLVRELVELAPLLESWFRFMKL